MVNEEAATVGDETAGGNGVGAMPGPDSSGYDTNQAEPSDERKALVEKWCKRIKESRDHKKIKNAFERMRKCMKIAAQGTDKDEWISNDNYVAPIVNRYINVAVASLYARNPKASARRKQKLLFQLWDGDQATLQQAMMAAQPQPLANPDGTPMMDPVSGGPMVGQPDPNAMALLQEVQQARQQMLMYDRLGKTMEILYGYYLEEQDAGYKEQFKALVRRTKVCGVAYVELGYQRLTETSYANEGGIADAREKIARLEELQQKQSEDELEAGDPEIDELNNLINDLGQQATIILREGPTLAFPKSTSIIPDRNCTHLKTFSGADWVAKECEYTEDEVEREYKVKLDGKFTKYTETSIPTPSEDGKENCTCRVWEVQDKKNQQTFVVCDGYPDFLKAPAEPDVKIERFWTLFPLVFNEIESEDEIFPPSDVWNARHMQREYNSLRQGLREHRIAARPRPVAPKGVFESDDKKNFANQAAFELIEINALVPGEDVNQKLAWLKTPGVDPNLYEVETTFSDVQRTVGAQEADFGGTSGDTATEASISEHSRSTTNSSDVDDLDSMLTALIRAMGQLMMLELSKETVQEIVGPGAVWPDLPPSREQIAKDLFLEVEAGSSGKPNKAAELANLERAMPFIVQMPGINPMPIGKKYLGLLEINTDEAQVEGLPSMVAMNQNSRNPQGNGDDSQNPDAQGDKGRQNASKPQQQEPGGQPAFPAPRPV
jgi:hypothetical protein